MGIITTEIEGLYLYEPRVFSDERGYFFECFNAKVWEAEGVHYNWVQDNESRSKYGTIRGMHYQTAPHGQAKLIRVTKGKVLDIVIDLRKDSKTYGDQFSVVLSNKNKRQMLIPRGFAHGFVTLSREAVFNYKCDNYYHKESEAGINPLDESLKVKWKIDPKAAIVSEKDEALPMIGDHVPYEK